MISYLKPVKKIIVAAVVVLIVALIAIPDSANRLGGIIISGIILPLRIYSNWAEDLKRSACESRGGKWTSVGLCPNGPCRGTCVYKTNDGGKPCLDSKECEAGCEADDASIRGKRPPTGHCSEWNGTVSDCGFPIRNGEVHGWCL